MPIGTPSPPPCQPAGTPAVVQQAPPAVIARREFVHTGNDAYLTQDVYGYPDATRAQTALALFERSFACSQGTAYYGNGTTGPVVITSPTPIGTDLNVDDGMVYTLRFATEQGTVLVARIGATLLILTFIALSSAQSGQLPDGQAIAALSVRKIHTAR